MVFLITDVKKPLTTATAVKVHTADDTTSDKPEKFSSGNDGFCVAAILTPKQSPVCLRIFL